MPPISSTDFGKRLRERREELGLSLRELAKQSGVSSALISYIEAGERNAPTNPDRLRAIAEALNLPASEVFKWVGMGGKADLPAIVPYLRTVYRFTRQDAEDVAKLIEQRAEALRKKGGRDAKPSR